VPSGVDASSTLLPSAPTDQERDLYAGGNYLPLAVFTAVAGLLVLVSSVRFTLLATPLLILLPYLGFIALYALVALYINCTTKSFDVASHAERVAGWAPDRLPSVDVFLPVAGEPLDVLRNTWTHVRALQYGGPLAVYVLDDSDSAHVRAMAESFGFAYLVRADRPAFKKAGNLRNGFLHSDGEFIAIFDADFTPRPDYLTTILPYFDEGVGIVQTPQYFRVDGRQSWLERGAGAVQEFFYRVVQPARQRFNGSICVGTCAIYRRRALEDNGGTTLIEHSEDVHTGFDVRGHGWDLRYVPLNLATGACPDTLPAFFRQQYRWCMGSMSLLLSRKFWGRRLPLLTRGCYFSGFFYYIATAVNSVTQPLIALVLLLWLPEHVALENYVYALPAVVLALVVRPLWHRSATSSGGGRWAGTRRAPRP
jgi:cellulose synthase (UDP-forming)